MSDFNMDSLMNNLKVHVDRFKDDAERLTKKVVKKTNSTVSIAKLNYAVREAEEKAREILAELGEMVYKEFVNSGDAEGEISEKCKKLNELYGEIDSLKDQISELKDTFRCPNCGEYNDNSNAYCSACGTKLSQDVPPDQD